MSLYSILRLPAVIILAGLFLPAALAASEPRAEGGGLRFAAAALDDELFDAAEIQVRQYPGSSADVSQWQEKHAVILARALHGQKRFQEMLTLLKQGRGGGREGFESEEYAFWLALAFYENRQYAETLDRIGKFRVMHPASHLADNITRLEVRTLLKTGRETGAIAILERLAAETGNGQERTGDRLFLGQTLAAAGRLQEAAAILEKLLAWPPDTSQGQSCRLVLGKVYLQQQQWQKAREVLAPLVEQRNISDGFRMKATAALAEIAAARTNYSEALSLIDSGARLISSPQHALELNLHRGRILIKLNKLDEGTALIHEYVGTQTNKASGAAIQLDLARSLLADGMHERALAEFDILLESFASQADLACAFNGRGEALYSLGRYHEAAAAFARAEESSIRPADKALYCYRSADALFALAQFKQAAVKYAQAAAFLPESALAASAMFQSAECQVSLGNMEGAEELFWQVYEADPEDSLAPRALLRIAEIYALRGGADAAGSIHAWIESEYPARWQARAMFGRGMIAYRAGSFAGAGLRFKEALRLSQSGGAGDEISADAVFMNAWSCFMLSHDAEARDLFAGLVRDFPRSARAPEALFWLGGDDYNRRRFAEAEKSFRRLAEEYPKSSLAGGALFWAGRCAMQQNEFRRGRDYFSSVIKNHPASPLRPEARYFQGAALCELGLFDAAILIFNEIIAQYPDHELVEQAAFRKADCQFILGSGDPNRYEEAMASYQFVLDRPDCSDVSRLQAKYKIGRCLEKLGKTNEAVAQFMGVVYAYLQDMEPTPAGNIWFTRAAFNAAGIMEEQQQWRKAANIYERVVEADIPASRDALERIEKLRAEHWLNFY